MSSGFDLHDRIDDQYGEDSYLAGTYDDQPTYGADFTPEDADSPEYADECGDYAEPDECGDFPDELSDGFGNRYKPFNSEMLEY